MAEIAGASITFTDYTATPTDPRLLNVPDVVGDVTVQDVLDTLSARQADIDSLVYDALLDVPGTSGKQQLSASKNAGIICTMIRTNLKFADLAGPAFTIKRVLDGSLVAIDGEVTRVQIEEMASSAFVNFKTEADVSAALLNPAQLFEVWQFLGLDIGQSVTAVAPTGDGVGFEGTTTVGAMTFKIERQGGGNTMIMTRLT